MAATPSAAIRPRNARSPVVTAGRARTSATTRKPEPAKRARPAIAPDALAQARSSLRGRSNQRHARRLACARHLQGRVALRRRRLHRRVVLEDRAVLERVEPTAPERERLATAARRVDGG